MAKPTDIDGAAAGLAALSICESLLLALSDHKIMGKKEGDAVLNDAAEAHRTAVATSNNPALQRDVVSILDRIISGQNSIPRR